jgi:hypothetical protein
VAPEPSRQSSSRQHLGSCCATGLYRAPLTGEQDYLMAEWNRMGQQRHHCDRSLIIEIQQRVPLNPFTISSLLPYQESTCCAHQMPPEQSAPTHRDADELH